MHAIASPAYKVMVSLLLCHDVLDSFFKLDVRPLSVKSLVLHAFGADRPHETAHTIRRWVRR